VDVVSSLAGRVSRPRLPVGGVRVGGFGGVQGLVEFVTSEAITDIVDATHPFATTMSARARDAGCRTGVRVVRYARPGWSTRPDAGSWHWQRDLDGVRRAAERLGQRPFLSSGRQTLRAFAGWTDRDVLVRVVEPLTERPPARWTVVEDRGPYGFEGELALMRCHRIEVLVTKDSGGTYTGAKLDAAAALGIPVVVLARPTTAPTGATEVTTVGACVELLHG